jgi:hypothetical protein
MELIRDTLNNYMFLSNTETYPVCVVHADKNNTVKSVEYYKQKYPLNTNEISESEKVIQIFPNPSRGQFNLKVLPTFLENKPYTISIFDATGKEVERKFLNTSSIQLQNKLPQGTYLFMVINYKNEIKTGKLIISEK